MFAKHLTILLKHLLAIASMTPVAYIIPGGGESPKRLACRKIAQWFQQAGFKPVPVFIAWKRHTMSEYVAQFLRQHKPRANSIMLGFSFGAMISFIAASRVKPKLLLLCSLSPYWAEDLQRLRRSWRNSIGKRREADLKSISFHRVAKSVRCKTVLFVGNKEGKEVLHRVKTAHKALKNSILIVIDDAKHDLGQNEYLVAVKQVIERLRCPK